MLQNPAPTTGRGPTAFYSTQGGGPGYIWMRGCPQLQQLLGVLETNHSCALLLHHSRLSARLCWSHRQQGMVRGSAFPPRLIEDAQPRPSCRVGPSIVAVAGEEKARVPDPQSTRCAATAFVPCQFVGGDVGFDRPVCWLSESGHFWPQRAAIQLSCFA